MSKLEKQVEEQKKHELYDPGCCVTEEDEETCDYTGEECFGNKLFCEECDTYIQDNPKESQSSKAGVE